jgi:hypothetical protein
MNASLANRLASAAKACDTAPPDLGLTTIVCAICVVNLGDVHVEFWAIVDHVSKYCSFSAVVEYAGQEQTHDEQELTLKIVQTRKQS